MEKKETFSDEISDIKKEINSYVQDRIDLTKLQLAEDLSKFISKIAIKLFLYYIGLFVLLFLSMAVAFMIGSHTNSNELGFVTVAGFYFFIGLIFYLFKRKFVQAPVIKSFIQLFFPNYSRYDKE